MPVESYIEIFIFVCAILIIATLACQMASEAVACIRRGNRVCSLMVFACVGVLFGVAAIMSINLFHFSIA